MNKLTGKAQEDFTKWNGDRQFDMMLPFEYPIYLNALIIEWLDSVGLYIHIEPSIAIGYEKADCFLFRINSITERLKFNSRQEATEKAIEQANLIYNDI